MYIQLDEYPPYSDKKLDIFETHMNRNLICIHGYKNYVALNYLITLISKNYREMLLSEFSQSGKIIPCTRTNTFNNIEK